ncbi:glycine zipper 2TM domain-containing protein [Pelagerythrobacter sp.]|uniref:glycine zipper 2TM domain-containing protein n=1 Tax=Pelagerythrobacter sp. TaxID=2800702 RepID=UPI0035ADB2F6
MTARHATLLIGAAAGALAAVPAAAQTAEPQMPYEYAYPVPEEAPEQVIEQPYEAADDTVIFREQPVVQPLPGSEVLSAPAPLPPASSPSAPRQAESYAEPPSPVQSYEHERSYEYAYDEAPSYDPSYDDAPMQPPFDYDSPPPSRYAEFDRRAWLDDCRARFSAGDGRRDGRVAGGLIGAAAGGVIGNRIADGDRLAGTLIGAGVGGLAGLAAGDAIGGANDRERADDYCESLLARGSGDYAPMQPYAPGYPAYPYPAPAYPAPYGYPAGYYGADCGCGPAFTYMPVLVAIPQRAVVRETVREEWVEVDHAPAPKRRAIHRPAPKPDKRIKYSKGK